MYTKHLSKQQDQFLCAGPHHAIIWIIRWITPYNLHSLEYCQQEKVENLHALKIYLESKAFCQLSWQLFSEWKFRTKTAQMSFKSVQLLWFKLCSSQLDEKVFCLPEECSSFFVTEKIGSGAKSDVKEMGDKIVLDNHFTGKSSKTGSSTNELHDPGKINLYGFNYLCP